MLSHWVVVTLVTVGVGQVNAAATCTSEDHSIRVLSILESNKLTECQALLTLHRSRRRELVRKLEHFLSIPENRHCKPHGVSAAIDLLGELRSVESVDVLVKYIACPKRDPDQKLGLPEVAFGQGVPIEQHFPAVRALLSIGPSSSTAVAAKLRNTASVDEIRTSIYLLIRFGEEFNASTLLAEAIEKGRPDCRSFRKQCYDAWMQKFNDENLR